MKSGTSLPRSANLFCWKMSQPANHAEAIVDALLGMPREERATYLEQACGADAQQRLLVEGMLKAHEQAGLNPDPGIPSSQDDRRRSLSDFRKTR